jgi:hypothetical protein
MIRRAAQSRKPIDKSVEPDLGLPPNPTEETALKAGLHFVDEDVANDGPTAKDDLDALNAQAQAARDAAEKQRKHDMLNSTAHVTAAESAAAAASQFEAKNPAATPHPSALDANDICLKAIEKLYGIEKLTGRQSLRDLVLLHADQDALTVKNSHNIMDITRSKVEYQSELTSMQSALQGALLMLNNPKSATTAVRITGSPREQLLMTLAAQSVGLTLKNPVDLNTLPPDLAAELPALLDEIKQAFTKPAQNVPKPQAPAAAAPTAPVADAVADTVEQVHATPMPDAPKPRSTETDGAVDIDFTVLEAEAKTAEATPQITAEKAPLVIEGSARVIDDMPKPESELEYVKKTFTAAPAPTGEPPVLTDIVEPGKPMRTANDRAEELLLEQFGTAATTAELPALALSSTPVTQDNAQSAEPAASLPPVIYMPGPDADTSARDDAAARGIKKFPLLKYSPDGKHKTLCP